ncbi:MAG: hypothetical protein KAR13_13015 [Desulfobulbaceae bacterium]|nr:hypothetical protein [Desulfobulbaceae bacterium]MCK5436538.1 hypothetical protein [Desulfobulbaceae bacterium]MCK5544611.1 hypothetical protein [Desulfobulbaceae bacterium]
MKNLNREMRILLVLQGDWIAPRFDLATEVLLAIIHKGKVEGKPREILLSRLSGEELCGLIVKKDVTHVICGGIEEGHYQYLTWKGVDVIDQVIGKARYALRLAKTGQLVCGTVIGKG